MVGKDWFFKHDVAVASEAHCRLAVAAPLVTTKL